jgi:hypothetical protein
MAHMIFTNLSPGTDNFFGEWSEIGHMNTKLFPIILVTVAMQLHVPGGEPRENYVAHE